jgi:DNA (cytosine-5)-methyltransferase 1
MTEPLNVLSLFSGIGGIDLGLERAGMRVVGQVEIDSFCRAVLARHWPDVPLHDDVRTCVKWWRGQARPNVQLICAGFPCQPVSIVGPKRGVADERWLWPATAAVIRALRPPWILLENVPGLLRKELGYVLGDLAGSGYDAEWDCLPASAFGAPHRRERIFVVAYLHHAGGRIFPAAVANPNGKARKTTRPAGGQVLGSAPVERPGRRGSRLRSPWAVEPDVGRVAHGVPARLDRLRVLGNAVVPQVAEYVGHLIVAGHNGGVHLPR